MGSSREMKRKLESLVQKYIAPQLSDHDFVRSGLTWNRQYEGIWHVLNLQVSRWSEKHSLEFTLNVGVLIQQVWETCWEKPLPEIVKEVDCFPRCRVSYLVADSRPPKDLWWTLDSSGECDAVGKEVEEIILDKCLPFLDRCDSIAHVLAIAEDDTLRKHPADKISHAILKHLAGQVDEAQSILQNLLVKERPDAWNDRIEAVSRQLVSQKQKRGRSSFYQQFR